jgi:hypothetical protein
MGVTAKDSRGASSLHNAMRTRRLSAPMTVAGAEKAGIVGNAAFLLQGRHRRVFNDETRRSDGMVSLPVRQLNNGRVQDQRR